MKNYTKSVDSIDYTSDNVVEIVTRLQQLPESAALDIPAYLRRDLLKWLRQYTR